MSMLKSSFIYNENIIQSFLTLRWARAILKREWTRGVCVHPNFQSQLGLITYIKKVRLCFRSKLNVLKHLVLDL